VGNSYPLEVLMLMTPVSAPSRRRALRRAVALECAVHSPLWDGPAFYLATDLSPDGLWLNTDLTLEVGERLMLSFRPPRWPDWCWPVMAFGEVVRVSLLRRRSDRNAAGMAVRFEQIDPVASQEMTLLLRGLPPPLPRLRPLAPAIDPEAPHALVLDDGSWLELRAEAPLLSAARPARLPTPTVDGAAQAVPRKRRGRERARDRARELSERPRRGRRKQPPKLRLVV
jgi:hypothetical protein